MGGIHILNIFALRATDPGELYAADDPVGPDNDGHIVRIARSVEVVVAGWGNHGSLSERGKAVWRMLVGAGVGVRCLSRNASGHPRHPLYVPYSARLESFCY